MSRKNLQAAKDQINREAQPVPLDTFFDWFQTSYNFYSSTSKPLNNNNHDGRLGDASVVMPHGSSGLDFSSTHQIQPALDRSIQENLESREIRTTTGNGNNARIGNRSLEMSQGSFEAPNPKYPNSRLRKYKNGNNKFLKAHEDVVNFKLEDHIIRSEIDKYNELDLLSIYTSDMLGVYDFIESDVIHSNIQDVLDVKEQIVEDAKINISKNEVIKAQVNVSKYNQLLPAIEHTINNLEDFDEAKYRQNIQNNSVLNVKQKDYLKDFPSTITACISMLKSTNGIYSEDSVYHPLLFRSFFSRLVKPEVKLKVQNSTTYLQSLILEPDPDIGLDSEILISLSNKIETPPNNLEINEFLCAFLIASRFKYFSFVSFDPGTTLRDKFKQIYVNHYDKFLIMENLLGPVLDKTYGQFMQLFGFTFFSRDIFFRTIFFLDDVFVQQCASLVYE